ncbi:hypothetical protein QPL26_21450 [Escherichia coli]|nr:hypothetical protein [Escherichia coli]MDS1577309.1 hypothetical protein [Escherichia coli]MDS1605753.1 hypothetical protein [Escherichia coli]MDS1643581.1 hypothetical protein [Escherichia coli]
MLVILRSHDFTTAEQVAAFLGGVPVEKYSGTSVRRGSETVSGFVVWSEISLMKAMYERLCLRGKAQNVCHWCADEKTRALVGVLKTQKPFDVGYLFSYARSACKAA